MRKKPIAVKINNKEEYELAIKALDLAGFKWFLYPKEHHISTKERDEQEFYIFVDPSVCHHEFHGDVCVSIDRHICVGSTSGNSYVPDLCNVLNLTDFVDFFSSMTEKDVQEFLESYYATEEEEDEEKPTITECAVKDMWNMLEEKGIAWGSFGKKTGNRFAKPGSEDSGGETIHYCEIECELCGSHLVEDIIGDPYKVKCRACGNVFYRDDEVYHPKHYTEGKHEVIDIIKEILTGEEYIGYLKGNIIKYSCRAGLKGERADDIRKRDVYTDFLKTERKQNGNSKKAD